MFRTLFLILILLVLTTSYVCGQDEENSGGGDSNDPTAPIMQLRFQNLFGFESRDASGYSNQVILQPVIPLMINDDSFFEYRIFRPTTPQPYSKNV